MGTGTSDLSTYNMKAQAGALSGNHSLYKLVGVSGDGELVKLVKPCLRSRNFAELDEFIRANVASFLYNDGGGENVSTISYQILVNLKLFNFAFKTDTCSRPRQV
jgi:hypothetical protein